MFDNVQLIYHFKLPWPHIGKLMLVVAIRFPNRLVPKDHSNLFIKFVQVYENKILTIMSYIDNKTIA